jgi:fatty acid desaturase
MRRDSIIVILMQLAIMLLAWKLLNSSLQYESFLELKEGALWVATLVVQLVLSYAIIWTIPLFCITVFLNRCRIVIEHGLGKIMAKEQLDFNGPRIPTVEVVPTTVERWLFAPFNFNYHCSHHAFMTIPHYNLKELHKYLFEHHSDDGNKYGLIVVKGGYLRALWTVVNHPVVWK